MAALSNANRFEVWSEAMEKLSGSGISTAMDKVAWRTLINAVDDWVDSNAASYNSALPVAAQTELSAKQKAAILLFVVNKRWEIL